MDIEVAHERALITGRRLAIETLKRHIETSGVGLPAESCPVQHYFAPGAYAREITMPAGMVVIGHRHRHAHVNIVSKGRVRVFTEQEGEREFVAPCTFISSPDTQRAVEILEETVWTTVHVTDKTDLAEIAREVLYPETQEA